MTLPKRIELPWQIEVIESWLNVQDVPSEAREGLLAMQRDMKEQMEKLDQSRTSLSGSRVNQCPPAAAD